jgi:glycosyltransferase involved in cell wall biosynthesis
MRAALQQAGLDVVPMITEEPRRASVLARKTAYKLAGRRYLSDREPSVLARHAQTVHHLSRTADTRVVLSPGTVAVSALAPDTDFVFWTDATFGGLVGFYPEFSSLCRRSIRDGHRMEQRALDECALALYASEWAARTAIDLYGADPAKVHVVPFGANFTSDLTTSEVQEVIDQRELAHCELLFVGVDWQRKGGDVAVEVAAELNRRGRPTRLHVVGCNPPTSSPEFVVPHGFISKATPDGISHMTSLFRRAHFLILPTRAACFGVVFAEAASFGVPSMATRVGGVGTAVGETAGGFLASNDCAPAEYADFVVATMSDPGIYRSHALSSRRDYETRLNWTTSARCVADLLRTKFGD